MVEQPGNTSLGRRRVILGLTGLLGAAVAGCSFNNPTIPAPQSQEPATSQVATPGVTPTPTPTQGTTLHIYKGHTNGVNDLVWSPDSKWIASYPASYYYDPSSTRDYSVRVWDAATGQDHFTYQTLGADTCPTIAWSPDGKLIALSNTPSNGVHVVSILDAHTGKKLVSCDQLKNAYFFQLAWSPDSSRIAVAGDRDVEICDANSGQKLLTYPAQLPPTGNQTSCAVAWSPDGNTIASAAANLGHSVQFWDAHSDQPIRYFSGTRPFALSWSPSENHIFIRMFPNVQVQDVNTGQIVFSVPAVLPAVTQEKQSSPYGGAHPHTVCWSPDGKYLAMADGQKQVQIWNVASKSLVYTYKEHTGLVLAVGWSPDGSRIASAGVDQTVRVWQAL